MTTFEYIHSKRVTIRELQTKFQLTKECTDSSENICLNCGDTLNTHNVPSEEWTEVYYCNVCNAISVRFPPDLMSGCVNYTPGEVYMTNDPTTKK